MALGAMLLFSKRRKKHTPAQLYRSDFKSSTQRMGVRFTERLRDSFRSRWLKLK